MKKGKILLLAAAVISVLLLMPSLSLEARAYSANDYYPYIPIVEQFLTGEISDEECRVDNNMGMYGILYDLDNNGVAELIVTYSADCFVKNDYEVEFYGEKQWAPALLCDVYTISDGKAVPLIRQEFLGLTFGGWTGYAAVLKGHGKTYFAATYNQSVNGVPFPSEGMPSDNEGGWTLYSIDGTNAALEFNTDYKYQEVWGKYKNKINPAESEAYINGEHFRYDQYEDWLDDFDEVRHIYAIRWSENEPNGPVPTMPGELEALQQWLLDGDKQAAVKPAQSGSLAGSYGKQFARSGKSKSFPYSEYEKLPKNQTGKDFGFTYPFELSSPLRQCKGFHLDYEIKEVVKGKLNEKILYEVQVRDAEGKWKGVATFTMENYSASLDVQLEQPMRVEAIAVSYGCPDEVAFSFEMAVSNPK